MHDHGLHLRRFHAAITHRLPQGDTQDIVAVPCRGHLFHVHPRRHGGQRGGDIPIPDRARPAGRRHDHAGKTPCVMHHGPKPGYGLAWRQPTTQYGAPMRGLQRHGDAKQAL